MPDPGDTEKDGFGALAESDRERRSAREMAAWDAAFAAANAATGPAPVADQDGAHPAAFEPPAHSEEKTTAPAPGAARPDNAEVGGVASPRPGGEVSEPPGATHHVTWGNAWLSITAHYAQRELSEAEPRRRVEEPHAATRRERE